jgi:hypothetical protein
MKRTLSLCAIAGTALALPFSASAQSADAKYCLALANKYQGFVGARQTPNSSVDVAMARCREGQPAEAIPVLESALRNANVDLPPRDSARTLIGVTRGPRR